MLTNTKIKYFKTFQLNDTNAKLVICTDETAKNAKEAISSYEADTKKKVHFYSFGEVDGVENILTTLETISGKTAPDPVVIQNPKTETCLIFWSSGTTGLPKGICHSHWSTLHFMGFGKTYQEFDKPVVTTTCFFHVGGFLTGTLSLEKRSTYHHVSHLNHYFKHHVLVFMSMYSRDQNSKFGYLIKPM